jgi:hypothetical protein
METIEDDHQSTLITRDRIRKFSIGNKTMEMDDNFGNK